MIERRYCLNSSDVRKNWSVTIDSVVHDRPAFIARTHDYVTMIDSKLLFDAFRDYKYHFIMEKEDDGSITGFIKELGLADNAPTKDDCIDSLINSMKDYALDYYSEFSYWSKAPNRVSHIPYVLKILVSSDDMIREDVVCQDGEK